MNFKSMLIVSVACLLASSSTFAAKEKVYKWTDAKGQTHYSQHPPLNTETEVIKTQTGHSDPVNYSVAAPKAEQKEEAKAELGKNKERCELARKSADTLKTYARIRVKGDDGEYRYITPDEQKQKLTEATKAIEESCGE